MLESLRVDCRYGARLWKHSNMVHCSHQGHFMTSKDGMFTRSLSCMAPSRWGDRSNEHSNLLDRVFPSNDSYTRCPTLGVLALREPGLDSINLFGINHAHSGGRVRAGQRRSMAHVESRLRACDVPARALWTTRLLASSEHPAFVISRSCAHPEVRASTRGLSTQLL
ncbi:hypothetical protein BR93DRAFT_765721 [Coniochaeta sp. PMI_546]|nr:hypothetical protein BR93DRAFT_765721 [Coniochaeta sp. PMI_546]